MSTSTISSKKQLGATLQLIRNERHYSQDKLAKAIKVSQATIGRIERGGSSARHYVKLYTDWAGINDEHALSLYPPRNPRADALSVTGKTPASPDKHARRRHRRVNPVPQPVANGISIHQETALALLREAKNMLDQGRANKAIASRLSAAMVILELVEGDK